MSKITNNPKQNRTEQNLCKKILVCGTGREKWNWEEKKDEELSRCVRLKIAKWKKNEWKVRLNVSKCGYMCVQPLRVSEYL
jgi:hypothetical protein